MTSVNITDEAMKAIVAEAIYKTFTPEKQQELIIKSIDGLLGAKEKYSSKTILQEMFESSVTRVARERIEKDLNENTEFSSVINEIMQKAILKLKDEQLQDKLAQDFAEKISQALIKRDY